MEIQQMVVPVRQSRVGSRTGQSRLFPLLALALALVCLTGCGGRFRHLMYNYMCDPYGQCGPNCPHATEQGAQQPSQPYPIEYADPAESQVMDSGVAARRDQQMQEFRAGIQEQMNLLDQQLADRSKHDQKVVEAIRMMSGKMDSLKQQIETDRSEMASMEDELRRTRAAGEDALANFESELDAVITQLGDEGFAN